MLGTWIERELLKEKERVGRLGVGSFSSHSRFEITERRVEGEKLTKIQNMRINQKTKQNLSPKNE